MEADAHSPPGIDETADATRATATLSPRSPDVSQTTDSPPHDHAVSSPVQVQRQLADPHEGHGTQIVLQGDRSNGATGFTKHTLDASLAQEINNDFGMLQSSMLASSNAAASSLFFSALSASTDSIDNMQDFRSAEASRVLLTDGVDVDPLRQGQTPSPTNSHQTLNQSHHRAEPDQTYFPSSLGLQIAQPAQTSEPDDGNETDKDQNVSSRHAQPSSGVVVASQSSASVDGSIPEFRYVDDSTQIALSSEGTTPVVEEAPIGAAPGESKSLLALKKFKATSMSLNKKFLGQGAQTDVKAGKASLARPATLSNPPTASPSSGPRLLTGKISTTAAGHGNTANSVAGWVKPAALPKVNGVDGVPSTVGLAFADQSYSISGSLSSGKSAVGKNVEASPWGKLARRGAPGSSNLVANFPTAQEVAHNKKLKAQTIAAALAARDKLTQDRAAASAAYNQQLLETLDAFRGSHLDPNANHWDDMDEDDDLFGEVVEFGDGTQYKLSEVPGSAEAQKAALAELEAQATSDPVSKSERFIEDYDRTSHAEGVPTQPPLLLRGRSEGKNLFNERLGKFEPYAGKSPTSQQIKSPDIPKDAPLLQRHSEDASSQQGPAAVPTALTKPSAAPQSLDLVSPKRTQQPLQRRSSMEQKQAPTGDHSRPRIKDTLQSRNDGRQLPPHMQILPTSPEPTSLPRRLSGRGKSDHGAMPLSPPREIPCQAAPHVQPTHPTRSKLSEPTTRNIVTPAASTSVRTTPTVEPPRPSAPPVPITDSASAIAPVVVQDIETLHVTEMASAAERARKRRQEEEDARNKEKERAKQKAVELELRMKASATSSGSKAVAVPSPSARVADISHVARNDSTSQGDKRSEPITRDRWRRSADVPPMSMVVSTSSVSRSIVSKPDVSLTNTSTTPLVEATRPAVQVPRIQPDVDIAPHMHSSLTSSDTAISPGGMRKSQSSASQSLSSHAGKVNDRSARGSWRRTLDMAKSDTASPLTEVGKSDQRQPPPHLSSSSLLPSTVARPSHAEPRRRPARSPSPPPRTAPLPVSSQSITVALPVTGHSSAGLPTMERKSARPVPDFDAVMSRIKVVMSSSQKTVTPTVPTIVEPPDAVSQFSRSSNELGVEHSGKKSIDITKLGSTSKGVATSTKDPSTVEAATGTNIVVSLQPSTAASSSSGALQSPSSVASSLASEKRQPTRRTRFDLPHPKPDSVTPPGQSRIQTATTISAPNTSSSRHTPLRLPPHDFLQSRRERASSPAPVWKVAKLKIPKLPRGKLYRHMTKQETYRYLGMPARHHVLTWDPPLSNLSPRTLSRDDLLFRKKYHRGVVVSTVAFPKRKTTRALGNQDATGSSSSLTVQQKPVVKGGAGNASSKAVDQKNSNAAAALPVPTLFAETVVPPSTTSQPAMSDASSKRSKSKLPEGSKVAFSRPTNVVDVGASSGMFMVMSEIVGNDKVEDGHATFETVKPKSVTVDLMRSNSTPGGNHGRAQETSSTSLKAPSAILPSLPSSSPWTAFSVLDSQSRKVWSQPDELITASAGGPQTKTENSLQGISDDFPAALPRTLNEFKPDGQQDNDSPTTAPRPEIYPRQSMATQTTEALPPPHSKSTVVNASERSSHPHSTMPFGKSASPSGGSGVGQDASINASTNSLPAAMTESGTHQYPYSTAMPAGGFHVPPGYQLVPIGSVPGNSSSGQYTGYGMNSWTSPGSQVNGYPPERSHPYSPAPAAYPQALSPTYTAAGSQSSGTGSGFMYANQSSASGATGYKNGPVHARGARAGSSSGTGARTSEWNGVGANGPHMVGSYYHPNAIDPTANMATTGFTPFQSQTLTHAHPANQTASGLYGPAQGAVSGPVYGTGAQMPGSPYGMPMHLHHQPHPSQHASASYYSSAGAGPVGAGRSRGRNFGGVGGVSGSGGAVTGKGGSPYQAVPSSAFTGGSSQRGGY